MHWTIRDPVAARIRGEPGVGLLLLASECTRRRKVPPTRPRNPQAPEKAIVTHLELTFTLLLQFTNLPTRRDL
jgi:hypothetical protein